MDEVWVRIAVVAGALALAAAIGIWQRDRGRGPVRHLEATGLDPGLYLFSSHACPGCARARERMSSVLGEGGFVEFVWEDQPGVFADIGVSGVPAVLRVGADGVGDLYPGQPRRVLSRV